MAIRACVMGAAAAVAALALPAAAGTSTSTSIVTVTDLGIGDYSFVQGGFAGGALVTGSFFGGDGNADGQISFFDGEIGGFGMSFSGNADVAAFTLDLSSLFGLVYDLDGDIGDGLTLDIEGIGAFDGVFAYRAGPGPLTICDGRTECAEVTGPAPVPEPAALALLGLGLVGIGTARRRR
jgi:PEP-CTERM motif